MTILFIILSTLILSFLLFTLAITLRSNLLLLTRRFVCPAGMTMEITRSHLSHHAQGEKSYVISCSGNGKTITVNGRAYFCFWGFCLLAAAPVGVIAGRRDRRAADRPRDCVGGVESKVRAIGSSVKGIDSLDCLTSQNRRSPT